ncbi:MAG: DUF1801 domain-containing protein [Candidatus Limnocylindrales bacterium]
MKDSQTSAKRTTAARKASETLTPEELAALKETVQERKAVARRGGKADGEADVRAKIAEMPESDRVMAERFHAIVGANAPDLAPKTWYGMPAYANKNGKIVCFFQAAAKFKARYATVGFDEAAKLDEGTMWPTSFALTKLTAADEAKIGALVKKAVS